MQLKTPYLDRLIADQPIEVQVRPNGIGADARAAAIHHYAMFLEELGIDLTDPKNADMIETPRRVVDATLELFHDEPWKLTTFPVEASEVGQKGDMGMVMVQDIPLVSMCAHHMLPFYGAAHIAYIPDTQMAGISKLARLVQSFSKGPQTQEHIGVHVADAIMEYLNPRGCMVVIQATHTCMSIRGAKAIGAVTTTSALRGVFYQDMRTREEAMQLLLKLGK